MWKEVQPAILKVGDKVKVTGSFEGNSFDNAEGVVVGIKETYFSIEFKGEGVLDKESLHIGLEYKAKSCWNFNRTTTDCTFWRDGLVYYTIFNKEEAKHLVGKLVKASDDGIIWTEPGILESIAPNSGAEYPFTTKYPCDADDDDAFRFIQELSEDEHERIKQIQELIQRLGILLPPNVLEAVKRACLPAVL